MALLTFACRPLRATHEQSGLMISEVPSLDDLDESREAPTEQSDGSEDGFRDQKIIALNETVGNV